MNDEVLKLVRSSQRDTFYEQARRVAESVRLDPLHQQIEKFRESIEQDSSTNHEQMRRIAESIEKDSIIRHDRLRELIGSAEQDSFSKHVKVTFDKQDTIAAHSRSILESMKRDLVIEQQARGAFFESILPEQFRIPSASELLSGTISALDQLHRNSLAALAPSLDVLQSITAGITSPWIDTNHIAESFSGVGKLATLAEAINSEPFAASSRAVVRYLLGDWRGITIPIEIIEPGIFRDRLYVAHGLDTELVARPEPAFGESLIRTGIFSSPLPMTETLDELEGVFEDESKEEQSLRWQMQKLHGMLFRLERDLRNFIHGMMTRHFGQRWEKARLPGNGMMCKEWMEKRDDCAKEGREKDRLIDYADFTDYERILVRSDNWNQLFQAVFQDKQSVSQSFRRLEPVRKSTMHARQLTKMDRLLAAAEIQRILIAIRKSK